jgi:hypothetical protein
MKLYITDIKKSWSNISNENLNLTLKDRINQENKIRKNKIHLIC